MRGWIFYDGECALCRRSVEFWRDAMERRRFEFEALQAPWVRERLGLDESELLREMRVMLRDGRVFGGAGAIVELARQVWWARPLVWLARAPYAMRLLRAAYREIASRRRCDGDACVAATHGAGISK
ncbi:MAG TPA: DUF393 domain-containing protein [Candidatus Acidoferrales bacterium]|nr:DUF393 domain-containing protein [Candidatus Acidoferrales bacterium]